MTERRTAGAPGLWCLAVAIAGMAMISPAIARDAAFMQPGPSNGGGGDDEAVKVEPKSDIDVGDTSIHLTRRTTLFYVNESNAPVQVEKMTVNGDANVDAQITNDDCSKQGSIAPQSRCSVEVSVTPSSAGAWSVEALMTHNGAGRIARAKLSGKTAGGVSDEKKESGLAVSSSKEVSPVDFGEVEVGGKAARSALMVNDSPDPITLYSIDVIEADNGLKILDGGCAVDMELKSGESCPVTIIWEPAADGQISTDLIIRHSGRKGFAVVPVRGKTKDYGTAGATTDNTKTSEKGGTPSITHGGMTPPPTADELEKQMEKIPTVSAASLAVKPVSSDTLRLIGTVGNRAVILLPDGTSKVADLDDEIPLGEDRKAKVIAVNSKSVKISIDGKEKTLTLEEASDLVAKAVAAHEKSTTKDGKSEGKSSDKKASSSTSTPSGSKGASP